MAEEGGAQKVVQLFEPTYQLGPEEHERFRASAVKKIAEEVLEKYLTGVTECVCGIVIFQAFLWCAKSLAVSSLCPSCLALATRPHPVGPAACRGARA